jgi:hypothetical protein
VIVAVLKQRHEQSVESQEDAEEYYAKLCTTINSETISTWESEIKLAESNRLQNPAAMDILGSRLSERGTTDNMNSESSSNTSGQDWIMLGLSMEERQ